MRVLLTGARGFLGWHTRLRLDALTTHDVVAVDRQRWSSLSDLVPGVDAVIHMAGVNRGTDDEVAIGNLALADDLAHAIETAGRPIRLVYANSIQDGNGTPYGTGKSDAAVRLIAAAAKTGGSVVDVRLPNLFGEHGRPQYNSFVATFVAAVIEGHKPSIQDRRVELLHAQSAAAALIDALSVNEERIDPAGTSVSVQEVHALLTEFHAAYGTGEIPDLSSNFRVDLFNTYRSALAECTLGIPLTTHSDHRGRFVETVRCRGGEGQTSFSTTTPGVTRGEHYHLHKVERFIVLQGRATMALRRAFTTDVVRLEVTGETPLAVDMPVGWVHNITNTGGDVLLTQFWSHELFRPEAPDTYPAAVEEMLS